MPDNLFSNSPLVWSLLIGGLLGLPPLIHLINRLRYRRVAWAAMDFLLQSQRQNRKRIWLKQLLLLVARMGLLACFAVMFSHLGCRNSSMAGLLSSGTTHHYVILDDSLSMSSVNGVGESPFARALKTIERILQRSERRSQQLISIGRTTHLQRMALRPSEPSSSARLWDFDSLVLDQANLATIRKELQSWEPTAMAARSETVLPWVKEQVAARPGEQSIVYVLSDFRNAGGTESDSGQQALRDLGASCDRLELIPCESESLENLSITELRPIGNVRSLDVPIPISLTVVNRGVEPARNVQIELTQRPLAVEQNRETWDRPPEKLATLLVDELPAGARQTRTFLAHFSEVGNHAIRAELPSDSLALDNVRETHVTISPARKVLVVEGQTSQPAAPFLELALGQGKLTGLQVETRGVDALRDLREEELATYDVIFLLAIGSLEERSVRQLENFTRRGGGLALFLDDATSLTAHAEAFVREGQGLFPVPLQNVVDVPLRSGDEGPDLQPTPHPLFATLAESRNSPLDLVQISRFYLADPQWLRSQLSDTRTSAADGNVTVAGSVRGRSDWPLVTLHRFGSGKTALILTSAAPTWNNWARNPSFVVALLLLENELAEGRFPHETQWAGQPWRLVFDASPPPSQVVFRTPDQASGDGPSFQVKVQPAGDQEWTAILDSDDTGHALTGNPGIYRAVTDKSPGVPDEHLLAVATDPVESDLQTDAAEKLLRITDDNVAVIPWNQFQADPENPEVTPFTRILLVVICGLLVGEAWLALLNSYHAAPERGIA